MNYKRSDLARLYERVIATEDVDIVFNYPDDQDSKAYRLKDSYARVIQRQISLETDDGDTFRNAINDIFQNADWTGSQVIAKKALSNITINSKYGNGLDLLKYLSTNKQKLYSLKDLEFGRPFSFINGILSKLPDELKSDSIEEYIRDIHLNVIPKASTGVGLGEGTFTIFGTALKGNSGDLQWDGLEVEVKTNGLNNTGAILGGDGYINKVTDRLEAVTDYEDIGAAEHKAIIYKIDTILNLVNTNIESAEREFTSFKNNIKLFKSNKINNAIASTKDVRSFALEPLTNNLSPNIKGNASEALANRLKDYVNKIVEAGSKTKTSLPGQIATFFTENTSLEDAINIFNELRTYQTADVINDIKQFLTEDNYKSFFPKTNYMNFQRLVGSIAILSYQQNIGFDLLTTGNDRKLTMAVIDCRGATVSSIYQQLEKQPEIVFDLKIDVYEQGSFRSQTVIAKSPRIILK